MEEPIGSHLHSVLTDGERGVQRSNLSSTTVGTVAWSPKIYILYAQTTLILVASFLGDQTT